MRDGGPHDISKTPLAFPLPHGSDPGDRPPRESETEILKFPSQPGLRIEFADEKNDLPSNLIFIGEFAGSQVAYRLKSLREFSGKDYLIMSGGVALLVLLGLGAKVMFINDWLAQKNADRLEPVVIEQIREMPSSYQGDAIAQIEDACALSGKRCLSKGNFDRLTHTYTIIISPDELAAKFRQAIDGPLLDNADRESILQSLHSALPAAEANPAKLSR